MWLLIIHIIHFQKKNFKIRDKPKKILTQKKYEILFFKDK